MDDEEEMLYGDSSSLFSPTKEEPRRCSLPSADRDSHQYKAEPTHWCVLVRENGAMEVGLVLAPEASSSASLPLLLLLALSFP